MLKWIARALLIGGLATAATALPASAGAGGQATLADVRAATAQYHDVPTAEAAGYGKALPCFDLPGVGGMGQHYIKGSLIGATDPLQPAAMVYPIDANGQYHLGAVEWIVPRTADNYNTPPELFNTQFTAVTVNDTPLWVLHAWIWQPNPAGMFQNYNPAAPLCPGH
jgi:hypothetical protein